MSGLQQVDTRQLVDGSRLFFTDGTRDATGLFNMGGFKITSAADPTSAQDLATKNYVDTHGGGGGAFNPAGTDYVSITYQNALVEADNWLRGSVVFPSPFALTNNNTGQGLSSVLSINGTASAGIILNATGTKLTVGVTAGIVLDTGSGVGNADITLKAPGGVLAIPQTITVFENTAGGAYGYIRTDNFTTPTQYQIVSNNVDMLLNAPNQSIILQSANSNEGLTSTLTINGDSASGVNVDVAGAVFGVGVQSGVIMDTSAAVGNTTINMKSPGGIVRIQECGVLFEDNSLSPYAILGADDYSTPTQLQFSSFSVDMAFSASGKNIILDANQLSLTGALNTNPTTKGDVPTGGDFATAASSVDVASSFFIPQTTAGQTITIPAPTSTSTNYLVYVVNTGATSFTMLGKTVSPNSGLTAIWTGTVWACVGSGS